MGYNDLELGLLSCLIIHPEYMETTVLEEKYFKKYKNIWIYLKSFYDKFKTFDLTLMCSFSKNRDKTLNMVMGLMDCEVVCYNFKKYEQRLIDMYNQSKTDEAKIQRYYELASNVLFGNIDLATYEKEIRKELLANDEL